MCLVKGKCCAGRAGRAGKTGEYIEYCAAAAGQGSRAGLRVTNKEIPALWRVWSSPALRAGTCWTPEGVWDGEDGPRQGEISLLVLREQLGSGCPNAPANSLINEVELSHCTELGDTPSSSSSAQIPFNSLVLSQVGLSPHPKLGNIPSSSSNVQIPSDLRG